MPDTTPRVSGTKIMNIIRGDTYATSESRGYPWYFTNWPSLVSAASAKWMMDSIEYPATITTASVSAQQCITLELTSAQTLALPEGPREYKVVVVLANGHVVTYYSDKVIITS
jgi:hypothetical protein